MVNLPAFLALTRHQLADVPVILYFHENQLTYPLPEGTTRDYTYAYINYLSALSANRVIFNSAFHQEQFMEALPIQTSMHTMPTAITGNLTRGAPACHHPLSCGIIAGNTIRIRRHFSVS